MYLTNEAQLTFKEDVLARYPEEACGVVIGGKYFACRNEHPEPTAMFRIGRERLDLSLKHGPIEAVLHSHPYELSSSRQFLEQKYNPAWPSEADQTGFMADTVPWGIVATDGEGISELVWLSDEIVPLERRPFSWFTADCFSCVRDWHRLNTGIVMPNFTRKWGFWYEGINTIEDNLATLANATRYPTEDAKIGDIAVLEIGGHKVVNHLGVIVGNNEFLHQFVEKYAHKTRWDMWAKQTKYVFRLSK